MNKQSTGSRNMNKSVLKLAIPSILASITVPLVGMVDLAIAGRLGDATLIGGVAIATMLFDLLYWNMGFLRMGTGGMVAQAYGRRDFKEAMRVFTMGIATALFISGIILILQWVYVEVAFTFIECSPMVEDLARKYFFIRIWAAPATLSLYVFKGFFVGMQNAVSPMVVDITVNITNLVASVFFAFWGGMGFSGIAMGTFVAQYTGVAVALFFLFTSYRKLFKYINVKASLKLREMKHFFVINSDLFLRSVSFLFIYVGFTSLAAKYGDVELAVCTIMMKIVLLYAYFVDGFAYAGEALVGRFIGAQDKNSLVKAIKIIFMWSLGIGLASTIGYIFAGEPLVKFMAKDINVINGAQKFLPWLLIAPFISCIAFTWDGIFIGATASKSLRNSMMWSVVGFFASYYLFRNMYGIQALWIAFMVHLLIRTIYLSVMAKREVYGRVR